MARRKRPRRATGRPRKLERATRLRFEKLLSSLSVGLIHVNARDTNVAIERALRQVVTFLGVDRGGLHERAEGRPRLQVSWARPGLEESPPVTAEDQFPWVSGRLRRSRGSCEPILRNVSMSLEPLYTTKTDGLGMGLAIVRTIVRAHGGTVGAENIPGGGASFHVTLPADPEGAR